VLRLDYPVVRVAVQAGGERRALPTAAWINKPDNEEAAH
jgi:hypothetical protein